MVRSIFRVCALLEVPNKTSNIVTNKHNQKCVINIKNIYSLAGNIHIKVNRNSLKYMCEYR